MLTRSVLLARLTLRIQHLGNVQVFLCHLKGQVEVVDIISLQQNTIIMDHSSHSTSLSSFQTFLIYTPITIHTEEWKHENMERWRNGNMEEWKHESMEEWEQTFFRLS